MLKISKNAQLKQQKKQQHVRTIKKKQKKIKTLNQRNVSFSTTLNQRNASFHTTSMAYTDPIPITPSSSPFISRPPNYTHPYLHPSRQQMLDPNAQNYHELRESFVMPVPHHYNIGIDITDKHVFNGNGHKPAIIYTDGENHTKDVTVNYNFLAESSNKVANALLHMGIHKGDTVGVLMSQSIEVAILHAAILKIGAVTVPLSQLFGEEALEYRLNASKAKALFLDPNKFDDYMAIYNKLPHLRNVILSPHRSALTDDIKTTLTTEEIDKIQAFQYEHNPSTILTNNMHPQLDVPVPAMHSLSDILYNHNAAKTLYNAPPTTVCDDAVIIFTSGTTGNPKGAIHSHTMLLAHLPGCEFVYDRFPQTNDVLYSGGDVSWIGGLGNVLFPALHHGIPLVQHKARHKKFDPEAMLHAFEKLKVTSTFLPPTSLKLLREMGGDIQKRFNKLSLRTIGSGGECLGEAVVDWCRQELNITPHEFYGQTEANLLIGNNHRLTPVKPGSMGVAIPGQHIALVKDNQIVDPQDTNAVGEIAVKRLVPAQRPNWGKDHRIPDPTVIEPFRHPIMMRRYLNNPKATREKFYFHGEDGQQRDEELEHLHGSTILRNLNDVDAYLLTGDLAKRDADGYFYYVGRNDDIISTAGYRVGPAEVETTLNRHPAVSNCAVVGKPDPLRYEVVKAFVLLSPQAQKDYFGSAENYATFIDSHYNKTMGGRDITSEPSSDNGELNELQIEKSTQKERILGLEKELSNFVKSKLAKHEYPRAIEFVKELEMTTTGKVIRKNLRKKEYTNYYTALGQQVPADIKF